MSKMQITVRRWTANKDEPDISTYDLASDDTWIKAGSEPGTAACTLDEIMFVDPDGAILVETSGTMPPPAVLAGALPQSSEYLEKVDEIETGDEVLDHNLGTGLRQVAINGRRWSAFPLSDRVVWLECNPDELELDRSVPIGAQIASAGGIETDSMTSGWFSWSLLDVGGGYLCFISDPDEDSETYEIVERQGRPNRDLAEKFASWIDWDPVSDAVLRAIELGGAFEGVASELNPRWSDTCEVSAYVDLSTTE